MKFTERKIPRLKDGVCLFEAADKEYLRIGTSRSWYELPRDIAMPFYTALVRGASTEELSHLCQINIERCQFIVQRLAALSLLQTSDYTISLTERFVSSIEEKAAKSQVLESDIAFQQLRSRLSPELELSRWLPHVTDSGTSILDKRRNSHLEIHGESSAAPLLYSMLLASGVTNTEISPWMRMHNSTIGYADTSSGIFRSTEVGLDFRRRLTELGKEFALFPKHRYESAVEIESDGLAGGSDEMVIKVHFGQPNPQLLSDWMGRNIHHIFVSDIAGGTLTIGPYVKPGKSPCSRCFQLTYKDQSGCGDLFQSTHSENLKENKVGEIPVIAAHYIAALLASLIVQIIDNNKSKQGQVSDIEGAVLTIDLLSLANTALVPIGMHPLCGCQWQSRLSQVLQ